MAEERWVEVRDEPRHRRRFEDDLVRVYDVLIPPGDTTLYHRHTEDTFYVAVHEATVRNRRWEAEEARPGRVEAGSAMCMPHRSKPLIHQVQNVGEAEMRLIGAEIRRSPATTSAEPLEALGHTLTLDGERLRVYELALEPGASTGDIEYGFSSLTVYLTIATVAVRHGDGSERTLVHAPGDVVWRPAPTALSLTNVGEEPFRAVVGEWR
jgi:quercetin dioxygenase-like cupin family protein